MLKEAYINPDLILKYETAQRLTSLRFSVGFLGRSRNRPRWLPSTFFSIHTFEMTVPVDATKQCSWKCFLKQTKNQQKNSISAAGTLLWYEHCRETVHPCSEAAVCLSWGLHYTRWKSHEYVIETKEHRRSNVTQLHSFWNHIHTLHRAKCRGLKNPDRP
jgi:hypothetical protein